MVRRAKAAQGAALTLRASFAATAAARRGARFGGGAAGPSLRFRLAGLYCLGGGGGASFFLWLLGFLAAPGAAAGLRAAGFFVGGDVLG